MHYQYQAVSTNDILIQSIIDHHYMNRLLAEVNLSDEFDSSSDTHELEEKFKCRECKQTFSTESNLNFRMSLCQNMWLQLLSKGGLE